MIVPRDPDVDLSGVPRRWLADNAVATAIANGVNLLFPQGERFFVRSVNHFLDTIDDPALRDDVRAFFKQEGRHASAHDDFNAHLRAQGYELDRFLARYRWIGESLEARFSPELNLAVTAACEHFTAILAHGAFAEGILDTADPRMQRLLGWHAAEEIEHKAVAYDVLARVAPSYALRIRGLALATVLLGGFWIWASAMLMRQDGLGVRGVLRDLARLRRSGRRDRVVARVFVRGIRSYLRRDFHPDDVDDRDLAAAWFAARGTTLPGAA
jgi:uncharacterized protein